MKFVKNVLKKFVWQIISNKEGYNDLKVLSGPAKGAILRLNITKEASYWLGTYDKWILSKLPLEKIIQKDWVVWDCGAYVGYYTAIFKKIACNGKIFTFEASRKNYDTLKIIPSLNNWKNVFIMNLAVGPDHSTIKFVNNLGGSNGPFGLSKNYAGAVENLEIEEVTCCGVDELVYERNIDAPDFIKFDLESAEEFALHNGHRIFSTKRPIILLELHGETALKAAGKFLEKYNYTSLLPWEMPDTSNKISDLQTLSNLGYIPHMIYCFPN